MQDLNQQSQGQGGLTPPTDPSYSLSRNFCPNQEWELLTLCVMTGMETSVAEWETIDLEN